MSFWKYIRRKICRAIYYADFKPDNSKDWKKNLLDAFGGIAIIAAFMMFATFLFLHF